MQIKTIKSPTLVTLLLVLLLFSFTHSIYGQCQSDITLNSQVDIDSFSNTYGDCEVYEGNITIGGYYSSITNLDGLLGLKEVRGHLVLELTDIVNLKGLDSLQIVGGDLAMYDNCSLLTLNGLGALDSVGSILQLNSNYELFSLQGIDNIRYVGDLIIKSSHSLTSLSGLESLQVAKEGVSLNTNDKLMSTVGLENLEETESIVAYGNKLLQEITGFEKIKTLEAFSVTFNKELKNITGLPSLETVSWRFRIEDNESLVSIEGFPKLTSVGELILINNVSLKDLSAFYALTNTIDGGLLLSGLPALENLEGLNNLTAINSTESPGGGNLIIDSNSSLKNIDALSNVKRIHAAVSIFNNAALENINGLGGLETIRGNFSVRHNHALKNIDGLKALKQIDGYLHLTHNAELESINMNPELKGIQQLWIRDNIDLIEIGPFSAIDTIPDGVIFAFNDVLDSLPEFASLKHVGTRLQLFELPALKGYEGFKALNTIQGLFGLYNNAPESLSGFESLKEVKNGRIMIQKQPNLTTLKGLSSDLYEGVDSLLIITDNPLLSDCAVDIVCHHLGEDRPYDIGDNLAGCNTEDEIITACASMSTTELEAASAFSVSPNPSAGMFNITWESRASRPIAYTVFNSQGRQVEFGKVRQSWQLEVDLSEESDGLYFVQLRLEDGALLTQRLVKVE